MRKVIAVYGSTGTIGENTLAIVRRFPERFQVASLAAGRNIDKLRAQIREFQPKLVAVQTESGAQTLRAEFPQLEVMVGESGLRAGIELNEVEMVVMGIVGFAALSPTLHAIRLGKDLALANKESLVVGGPLLKAELARSRTRCIPVDSEHNALFQLLEGQPKEQVETIVLTASGGPLWKRPEIPLEDVTPAMAVAHPNWKMGPKISVDSATLMNKGLELIEAHFLFGFASQKIEVWVHPQSILHGALWMTDNSCLAQLTKPDMKASIGHALSYPDRLNQVIPKLSFQDMSRLEFFEPDNQRFPALRLARQALESGPSYLVVLNAANEVAVERFLSGCLLFSQIPQVIEQALSQHPGEALCDLESLFALDESVRSKTQALLSKHF